MYNFQITDMQKIGVGLTGFGIFFIFFGVVLFFDKALLAIGNLLFLAGLALVIGFQRTMKFFFQSHKLKGSCLFFGGILMVVFIHPILGMLVETYGFFLLFSGFIPVVLNFMIRMPVIGTILSMPGINKVVSKLGGGSQSMA